VRDTGIGMTQEQASTLFRPFSQADESTTRRYGGTGLGLSISKAIVELMHGTIAMDSAPNCGSTLRFTAWFALGETPKVTNILPSALNGMRILVVDDNEAARLIMQENLSALPVTVDLAANGAQALAAIRANDSTQPYNVVFTDLTMPQMDGIELIRTVKQDNTITASPRMVLVSAHGIEEMQQRAGSKLADGMMTKPVNPSKFTDTLVTLFAPVDNKNDRRAPRTRSASIRFNGLTILLVEDNEINQQIAIELMRAAGITVDVAANGRIAVNHLMKVGPHHYGLVFMDIQMPEMDGHEATQSIRADARFENLPIVAMTAHAMVQEQQRCLDSGMNDHIAKPINPDALYQIIALWCPEHVCETIERRTKPTTTPENDLIIEGIDIQMGLNCTLGNQAFYVQMLMRFRDGQRDTVAKIRAALLDEHDPITAKINAERIAHTLKGVSSQLGIKVIPELAAQLEEAIRNDVDEQVAADLLDQLDIHLKKILNALDRLQPISTHESQKQLLQEESPFDESNKEAMKATFLRIENLLRQSDAEAIDLLTESHHILKTTLGETTQQKIAKTVRDFDFEGALEALSAGAKAAGYFD